jgi:hypothetical protein
MLLVLYVGGAPARVQVQCHDGAVFTPLMVVDAQEQSGRQHPIIGCNAAAAATHTQLW